MSLLSLFGSEQVNYVGRQAQRWRGKKVLDVGCGSGHLTHLFGQQNETVGVDITNNVQDSFRNFVFHLADATELPFLNHSFDLVVSFDVIEHVTDDLAMLQEAHRVLRPGGRLLLGTPNRDRLSNRLKALFGHPVQYPLNLGDDPMVGPCIHLREYTADSLGKLAARVGFKDITITNFWFGLTVLKTGLTQPPRALAPACQYYFLAAAAETPVNLSRT